MKNIPYSKYKTVNVSGQVELTTEQMAQFKQASEETFSGDWDRLVPQSGGTQLVKHMLFKQDSMETILEDIKVIAKRCPFLNIVVAFSHNFLDDEGVEIEDSYIGTITVKNGTVSYI